MSHLLNRTILTLFAALLCALYFRGAASAQLHLAPVGDKNVFSAGMGTRALMETAQGEWNIEAASISYDQTNQLYEAQGNVRIASGDRSIQADWARLDAQKREAELRGNVHLKYGKDWLKGDHVVWKLDDETGWVDGGMVYFSENNFYVMGQSILKTGPKAYELKEGFLTSCDPATADWKIRYGEMKINLEGLAWAKDTSFLVRDTPVMYSPIVAMPVQTQRQSGFLIPWGGFTRLNGYEGELPFYWAIREDMDVTIYAHAMTERGFMGGLEYRIAHERWGEGIWLTNYLQDQVQKDHLAERGFSFIQRDRYWLRARHAAELPYEIHANLDLDVVSDRNYLQEFTKGSTAFGYSNKLFREFFGRGILSDKTILARESSLYLEKDMDSVAISMDTRYWDQLDLAVDDITLQRLPSFAFSIIPSGVDGLPMYYSLNSSLVHYWRQEGDRGNRLDVFPRVNFPLHWKNYVDIEPSIGVRGTSYWVDWQADNRDPWQGRLSSNMRVDVSSRLNRVYDLQLGKVTAVQHSIRPELTYEFIPDNAKGDTPFFDRLDGNLRRHYVQFGFTNFLTGKETKKDDEGNPVVSYREFARMQLFQLYNIEQPPEILPDLRFGPGPSFLPEAVKGYANLGFRMDVMPRQYLTLSYSADYSPDRREATQQDVFLTLDSGRGHMIRFDYQFRNDVPVDEFITELRIKILPGLFVGTYHDYSIERQTLFKQGYALRYMSGCWSVGLSFEKEGEDQRVAFSIDLLGLGSYGGGRARRLGEQSGIPFDSMH